MVHSRFNLGAVHREDGRECLTKDQFIEVVNMLYTDPGIDIVDKLFKVCTQCDERRRPPLAPMTILTP